VLLKLRQILYLIPDPNSDLDLDKYMDGNLDENDKETEDADPMKEGLFPMCMKEIDDYLHETKGCCEMQSIDSQALTHILRRVLYRREVELINLVLVT
jgi:hypothetical protein